MQPISANQHKLLDEVPEQVYEAINDILQESKAPVAISGQQLNSRILELNPGLTKPLIVSNYYSRIIEDYQKFGWTVCEQGHSLVFAY